MAALQELSQDFVQQTKGPTVLAVCISTTTVATIFVAARLYVRVKILSMISLDDWLIILSMVSGFYRFFLEPQRADAL
jgi:nitric oxide reductase large subunit